MPLKIECPRCKTRLQVPSKLAGGYVNCPQCKGRVWVDKVRKPVVPPPPPTPRKKVARFIAADATEPNVQLAADGKLPELHIEDDNKERKPAEAKPMNPVTLLGGLGAAALLWAVLILSIMGPADSPRFAEQDAARRKIESTYLGASRTEDANLKPYQILLREALMAHARPDGKAAEQANYRKVLNMLRAERRSDEKGLTGSASKDKTLEDAIVVLLSEE